MFLQWNGYERPGHSNGDVTDQYTLCIFNLSCEVTAEHLKKALKSYHPIAVLKRKYSCYTIVQFANNRSAQKAFSKMQVISPHWSHSS